jgi:hypothetical protein
MSILLSFFLPSNKTNHYFPPQEGCENKYFQDLNRKFHLGKERAPNDSSPPFKRKRREVKVDPKLGGQWNVPLLGG